MSQRVCVKSSSLIQKLRDPQGLRTDAELISVLQRAWLLPSNGPPDPVAEAKFSLDSTIGDEGSQKEILIEPRN